MKKVFLTFAAIGLFFTTTQAQVTETTSEVYTEANSEVAAEATGDEFEKIELTEIPAAVTEAITRDFADAGTQEAWVKEVEGKKVYKIKLNVSGEEKKVYADAEGNWIDMKEKKEKNKQS